MSIYIMGTNQSPKLPTGFLNSTGGDPAPGLPVSTTGVSGSIIQPYAGQVGGKLSLDTLQALGLSNTAIGTLFAGVYMYVQFLATSVASNARGQLVFWSSASTYVVTPDVTAASASFVAGVTLAAITKGNFGWIQIAGRASVLAKAALTKAGLAGDIAVVDDVTPSNTFDVKADATAVVFGTAGANLKSIIGNLDNNAANGAISQINMSLPITGWRF